MTTNTAQAPPLTAILCGRSSIAIYSFVPMVAVGIHPLVFGDEQRVETVSPISDAGLGTGTHTHLKMIGGAFYDQSWAYSATLRTGTDVTSTVAYWPGISQSSAAAHAHLSPSVRRLASLERIYSFE